MTTARNESVEQQWRSELFVGAVGGATHRMKSISFPIWLAVAVFASATTNLTAAEETNTLYESPKGGYRIQQSAADEAEAAFITFVAIVCHPVNRSLL